jgi:hypothetical protein
MPGYGREEISPVKGLTERGKEKFSAGDLIAFHLALAGKYKSKDAIVRPNEKMAILPQNDRPPAGAYSGVNDY